MGSRGNFIIFFCFNEWKQVIMSWAAGEDASVEKEK